MSDPPLMGMAFGNGYLSEVLVILPEDIGNLLLETGKLISKIVQF